MKRFSLKLASAMFVLANFALAAHSQTGPTGPAPSPTPTPMAKNKQQTTMTPERLAALLRDEGHQVEVRNSANPAHKTVVATVTRDGWRFVLEFECNANFFNVICPLGNTNPQYSATQLLALMKKSFEMREPMHFSFRDADKRLVLEDPLHPLNTTDEYVRTIVTRMITMVRETHPLWNAQNAPAAVNNQPAPNAPAAPVAPQKAPAPAPQLAPNGIVNTIWIGNETLGGYGKLEFRLQANGQAVMIDNDGTQNGTYTIQNNTVTLRFYNGEVVYTGAINGSKMSGTAKNSETMWSFSVNR